MSKFASAVVGAACAAAALATPALAVAESGPSTAATCSSRVVSYPVATGAVVYGGQSQCAIDPTLQHRVVIQCAGGTQGTYTKTGAWKSTAEFSHATCLLGETVSSHSVQTRVV